MNSWPANFTIPNIRSRVILQYRILTIFFPPIIDIFLDLNKKRAIAEGKREKQGSLSRCFRLPGRNEIKARETKDRRMAERSFATGTGDCSGSAVQQRRCAMLPETLRRNHSPHLEVFDFAKNLCKMRSLGFTNPERHRWCERSPESAIIIQRASIEI